MKFKHILNEIIAPRNPASMKLTLGYSPCPNDTFIFDALLHEKVDTEGLEFEVQLADVEALNEKAFRGVLDITKLSYHTYAYVLDKYVLLHSGSALGNNCGPLLISKHPFNPAERSDAKVAIPGKYTTANFLLSLAFPEMQQKIPMLFSKIEEAILHAEVEAGLIIHENRFTYAEKGLRKIIDLGEYWESLTQLPIPLGGIVVKRTLNRDLQLKIDRVLRRSVAFALDFPEQTMDYVSQHAQEMDPQVMQQHISLYVNNYTLDLGNKGQQAVQRLFDTAVEKGILAQSRFPLFL